MDYKVYKYTNIKNNKVYIGQTKQTLKKRAGGKKGQNYLREDTIFSKAIKKYGWENFEPEILFDNLDKNNADLKEIETILEYDSYNPKKGYNGTLGGGSGIPTKKTKEKISNGVRNSEKFAKNNFEAHAKKVFKIDVKNKTFELFESLSIAEEKTGALRTNIASVCYGKAKSAKKFLWKFEEDFNENDLDKHINEYKNSLREKYGNKRNKKISESQKERLSKPENTQYLEKRVRCVKLSTCETFEFKSLTDAANFAKIKAPSNISLVCNKKRNSAGGYTWEFIDN